MNYCIFQTWVMFVKPSQIKYYLEKLQNYFAFPALIGKQADIYLYAIPIFRRVILTFPASREQDEEEYISTSKAAIPVFLICHLQCWSKPLISLYCFWLALFVKQLKKGGNLCFLHKEKVGGKRGIKAFILFC